MGIVYKRDFDRETFSLFLVHDLFWFGEFYKIEELCGKAPCNYSYWIVPGTLEDN